MPKMIALMPITMNAEGEKPTEIAKGAEFNAPDYKVEWLTASGSAMTPKDLKKLSDDEKAALTAADPAAA